MFGLLIVLAIIVVTCINNQPITHTIHTYTRQGSLGSEVNVILKVTLAADEGADEVWLEPESALRIINTRYGGECN